MKDATRSICNLTIIHSFNKHGSRHHMTVALESGWKGNKLEAEGVRQLQGKAEIQECGRLFGVRWEMGRRELLNQNGAGICLSAKFSRHLGQRQLPSPVLAQSRAPAISQGRIRKQTKQKGNMSSWVLIIEILTAVIIETYYVCILFLILTN